MDRIFSLFGKIVLVLLVVGGVAFGGYYFGQKLRQPTPQLESEATEVKDQTAQEPQLTPQLEPLTPAPPQTQPVMGGVPKSAGLIFDLFTIEVPNDWSVERETGPGSERLYIRKNGYELSIFQAATGGALCLYPGDPDFEGPSSRFDTFVALTTADARKLRRSGSHIPGPGDKTGFTLCQQTPEGDFNQPTLYGHISYSLPKNYDQAVLAEMDGMISSLKAQ